MVPMPIRSSLASKSVQQFADLKETTFFIKAQIGFTEMFQQPWPYSSLMIGLVPLFLVTLVNSLIILIGVEKAYAILLVSANLFQ